MSLTAQIVLGLYAVLLGVGGVMGFVKAKSRPSLIAGLISAALAAGCVVLFSQNALLANTLGMALALLMGIFFGYRYSLSLKFMPAGLMALVSGVVLVILVVTRQL